MNTRFISSLIVLAVSVLLLLATGWQLEVKPASASNQSAQVMNGPCYATPDDGVTVFASVDASAVMSATQLANAGDTVKVAGTCVGVHPQAVAGDTISQTVYIIQSLTLQGGHTPNDWTANPDSASYPTVLDANGQGRVVVLDDATGNGPMQVTLDHLTLQNGVAVASPSRFNLIGGGLYVDRRVEATMSNSTLLGNSAGGGGGIFNIGTAKVSNSTLSGNSAGQGGAIYNHGTMTVRNSTLSGNSGGSKGGGIFNDVTATVSNSTLLGNSATYGGGIFNDGTATVSNSTLLDNPSTAGGGGIFNDGTVTVNSSLLSGNSTFYDGGGGIANYGKATVNNSTLTENSADGRGGGIYNSYGTVGEWGVGTLTVNNSTLTGNSGGGGLTHNSYGSALVSNSIFAGNSGGDINGTLLAGSINNLVANAASAGGLTDGVDGNIVGVAGVGARPIAEILLPLADNGGPTSTHALAAGSLAMNNGDPNTCATADQRGYLRYESICDIGAFETVVQIASCAATPDNGITEYFSLDASAVQSAIHAAGGGDTVKVAGNCVGVQPQAVTSGMILQTVYISQSLTLEGGHWPDDWSASPDSDMFPTVLDANRQGRVVVVQGVTAEVTLIHLTLQNGIALGSPAPFYARGGGIYNGADIVTVSNSMLLGNSANSGGGIYNDGIATVITSTLSGNSANDGASLFNSGDVIVSNSTLSENSALNQGGGIYNNGDATVSTSTLSNNSADESGGGIYNDNTATVSNSTLSGNSALIQGGGIFNNGDVMVNNSTLSANSVDEDGGGIYNDGDAMVSSSTLAGNSADEGGGIYNNGTATVGNSIIANSSGGNDCLGVTTTNSLDSDGSCVGSGVIAAEHLGPLMDNGGATQTHALITPNIFNPPVNPAINTGGNAACPGNDQRGYPRQDGFCDIGAFEVAIPVSRCAATPDNGITEFFSFDASAVQTAAQAATDGGTVKVAGTCVGVQAQAVAGGTISQTVYISQSLTLEGGYTPGDWSASPDSATHPTVLDANGQGRVVVVRNDAAGSNTMQVTLAHLTLQNGLALGSPAPLYARGGGIYNGADILTVSNSTLLGNSAGSGGGIYNNGDVMVSDSALSGNSARFDGGGIYNISGTKTMTVSNSALTENSADDEGGGIYNAGLLLVRNSKLVGNSSGSNGGGIYSDSGTVTVRNSRLSDNSAEEKGGGIGNAGMMTVSNSTLSGNSATEDGGGIENADTMTVSNSTLLGNSAEDGGGIGNVGTVTVINSTLSGNSADKDGGGIYNEGTATVSNNTLSSNSADEDGGGIYNAGAGSLTVSNSIIANSINGGDCVKSFSTVNDGGHNLIEASGSNACDLQNGVNGNIVGEDPQLGPLDHNGGLTQTYAIDSGSPAFNRGNNANCPSQDQRGNLRQDGLCDIGAYEGDASQTFNCAATPDNGVTEYLSFDASAVWEAVEAVAVGGTVKVAGTCVGVQPQAVVGGTISQTVYIIQSLSLQGGHTPSDWGAAPDSVTHPTVLDANGQGRVVLINDAPGGPMQVTLNHLTLQNGVAVSSPSRFGSSGGGVYVDLRVKATVSNSTLSDNSARSGGGIFSNGDVMVSNSTLTGNSAINRGGAIHKFSGTITVNNSTLSGNSATSGGGGISNNGGSIVVNNSTLSGNSTNYYGGGIYNTGDGSLMVSNSTLSGNSAGSSGGGLYNTGTVTLSNSIIANSIRGGDCITWGSFNDGGYNLIEAAGINRMACGLSNGINGNIVKQDPQLGPLADNGGPTQTHAINSSSPAYNRGDNANCPAIDQRGYVRDDSCDIGAYEFVPFKLFLPVVIRP